MRSLHFIFATGIVLPYALPTAPTGWLLCNGQALAPGTADHLRAQLIAAGNPYGVSGSDPKLPDLRGEFLRGLDNGRGVDSGRVLGSGQAETTVRTGGIDSLADATWTRPTPSVINPDSLTNAGPTAERLLVSKAQTTTELPGTMIEMGVRPRNVAMNYIIKT